MLDPNVNPRFSAKASTMLMGATAAEPFQKRIAAIEVEDVKPVDEDVYCFASGVEMEARHHLSKQPIRATLVAHGSREKSTQA